MCMSVWSRLGVDLFSSRVKSHFFQVVDLSRLDKVPSRSLVRLPWNSWLSGLAVNAPMSLACLAHVNFFLQTFLGWCVYGANRWLTGWLIHNIATNIISNHYHRGLRARFTNVDQAWTKFKLDLYLGLAIIFVASTQFRSNHDLNSV